MRHLLARTRASVTQRDALVLDPGERPPGRPRIGRVSGAPEPLPRPGQELADGVIRLRDWTSADLPCVRAGTGGGEAEAVAWIERQQRRLGAGLGMSLAIVRSDEDTAVGYVGLLRRPKLETGILEREGEPPPAGTPSLAFRPQPGNVGIGYWLLEEARGRGLATRAVSLLSRWALGAGGLVRIEALVEADNRASLRVVVRAGFRREGTLRGYLALGGRRTDALVLSLIGEDLGEITA